MASTSKIKRAVILPALFWEQQRIAMQDKEVMANRRQVEATKGRLAFTRFQEETGEDGFEQKFIGEEQESEIVAVSHWLQVVVSALLLGQEGNFLPFLKKRR